MSLRSYINEAKVEFNWIPNNTKAMPIGIQVGKYGDFYVAAVPGKGGYYVVCVNDNDQYKEFYTTSLDKINKHLDYEYKKTRYKKVSDIGPDGEMRYDSKEIEKTLPKTLEKERNIDDSVKAQIKSELRSIGWSKYDLMFFAAKGRKSYEFEKLDKSLFIDLKGIENCENVIINEYKPDRCYGKVKFACPMRCNPDVMAFFITNSSIGNIKDLEHMSKNYLSVHDWISEYKHTNGFKCKQAAFFYVEDWSEFIYGGPYSKVYPLEYRGVNDTLNNVELFYSKSKKFRPEDGSFERLVAGDNFPG